LKEFPVQTGDFDESKISQNIAWMDWVLQAQTKLTSEQMQGFLLLVYGARDLHIIISTPIFSFH
jgi:hypothetical protein